MVATRLFIGQDVLIDPFLTDMNTGLGFQPPRYLFRAPILLNQLLNPLPSFQRDARLGLVASAERLAQGLFGTLSPLTTIAPQFPTNSRFMHIDGISNLGLVVTNFLNKVAPILPQFTFPCNQQSCTYELNLRCFSGIDRALCDKSVFALKQFPVQYLDHPRDALRQGDVVGHHGERFTLRDQIFKKGEDSVCGLAVQVAGRLVGHEQGWGVGEGTGDGGPLLLTT